MRLILFLMCAIAMMPAQNQPTQPQADLILVHGNIYTGVALTSSFHEVQRVHAMAIRGERIVAIGEEDEVLKLRGPQTQVLELGGRFVMPGFNDAHLHLAEAGFERLTLDLSGVRSLSEFRARIQARAQSAAPGEWIVGGGWDQTRWPVQELPSRWDIDEVTSDHPVLLERVDGHIAVANTRALQLASVTVASKDPAGGQIDRDSTGQPTGILRETAREAVFAVLPRPSHEKRRLALETSLREAAQAGITSLQDNSDAEGPASWEDFQILEEIERDGKLTARVREWLSFSAPLETLQARRAAHPQSDNLLHTGMLKAFLDGSLGSRTAALLEPYADDPKNSGLPRYEQAKLTQMAKERMDAGFQLGFHAIGDKGVQMALDAFAAAQQDARENKVKAADGSADYRLRIEHVQVTNLQQMAKFKELNVIASMQPGHVLSDMAWALERLGPKRAQHSYPWAELQKKGVKLAFGSDYPYDQLSPFRALYAATTRKSEDGKREYFPEQKLSIEQAIAAYTTGSAYAEFAEKEKGTLAPGMLADFIVLDRDITAIPPSQVLAARVLRTVMGGKTVYEAK
jgi:predicted amidohydrolase YtcJ